MRAGVEVQGERTLLRALRQLERAGKRPPLRALAQAGAEHSRLTFRGARDPWGTPWRPLARSTIAGRRQQSDRPLRDTGRLASSIAVEASGGEAAWGTAVEYAAPHQFGARTRARVIRPRRKRALYWPGASHPVRSVRHPGSTIPARPFLPVRNDRVDLPAALRAEMLDVLDHELRRAIRA